MLARLDWVSPAKGRRSVVGMRILVPLDSPERNPDALPISAGSA
jgi:hypothetical protein